MTARQRFESARRRYLDASERRRRYKLEVLLPKYGELSPSVTWMTKGERDKLEGFNRADERARDAMSAVLDQHGGRNRSVCAPSAWVMEHLTWEDATTRGRLSVVPPPAYGYGVRDMERFAAPVEPITI